ncbi:hypothetical protein JHK87_004331 [Glycine soja]|nr:hypothetical protein JHK87_004331 [Glycine soja]
MSASSPSQAKEQHDDTKHLWTYVRKIKGVGCGGNYEIKCNICDVTFNGSYTRVRAHLLKITGKRVRGCQKITNTKLIDLKKIDNEATLRVEKSKTKSVSLPPVSTQHQMGKQKMEPLARRYSSHCVVQIGAGATLITPTFAVWWLPPHSSYKRIGCFDGINGRSCFTMLLVVSSMSSLGTSFREARLQSWPRSIAAVNMLKVKIYNFS